MRGFGEVVNFAAAAAFAEDEARDLIGAAEQVIAEFVFI